MNLENQVDFRLIDYRQLNEKFDRIVSVGMFEHVGRKNYKEYYDKCYNLLKNNGLMIIHTIGTANRKWSHNRFINKYIFPEGELPHLSNLTKEYTDNWNLEDMQNYFHQRLEYLQYFLLYARLLYQVFFLQ